jgi:PAS domain S-box-containing protein
LEVSLSATPEAGREAEINERIFETSLDLILVADSRGDFIRVSPSSKPILGYEPDEMMGRSATLFVHPADLDHTREEMRQARYGQMTRNFECRYLHKAGRPVMLWWTGRWSEAGHQYFFIGRDITERAETERRVRESEARLALAVETAEIGIVSAERPTEPAHTDSRFRRMYGLPETQTTIGAGQWLRLIHPEERDAIAPAILEAIRRGQPYRGEFRIRRADNGEERWIRAVTHTVLDGNGQPERLLGVNMDITEQRQNEEQIRQAQKMEAIGNLTGGMAHDFNNVLGVVIGNLEVARRLPGANAEADQLIAEAIEAATSGAELTRRLLAFARKQPLRPQTIQINSLVTSLARLLRRTLGENIEIALDLADDLWPVIADPAQLEAAITNLATNARDAMPNGGRLAIVSANRQLDADYAAAHVDVTPGDYAAIEITDTGTGMTPEIAERIFDPFFTTKELGRGTGLGLSMVFGFIKQSGGHINVYSESGAGTTFRLYLPRRIAAEAVTDAATSATEMPPVGATSAGEMVLAVEDNPALRRIVLRQLRQLGYEAVEADSAAAALDILAREKIDLLFSDIVMPGLVDGLALARQVRTRWPHIRVVLTSGFPGTKLDEQMAALGDSVRLLSKPYRTADLARLLRETLDR